MNFQELKRIVSQAASDALGLKRATGQRMAGGAPAGQAPAAAPPRFPPLLPWLGFLFFAGAFIFLASSTWRRWPDIMVDYGVQLYTPWQLSTGKLLNRDVAYMAGGPFSQYFHAVLFKIFGVSFTTLIVTSLILLISFLIGLYRTFSKAADRLTAYWVCMVTLLGFSFSQYGHIGNYNYICPYTYEAFHGLVLAVAAVACLWRWLLTGKDLWAGVAGLCSGSVFLTKPELGFALGLTVAAALLMHFLAPANGQTSRWKPVLFLPLGLAVPAAVCIIYYSIVWEAKEGFKAVARVAWPILTARVLHNDFYKWCLGLDRPAFHLRHIAQDSAVFFLGLAFLAYYARHFRRKDAFGFSLGALMIFLAYMAYDKVQWRDCGGVLGPAALLGCAWAAWRWWTRRHSAAARVFVFPLLWSLFALSALAKMGLFTRLHQYGFHLAMPASVFIVFMALWLLPVELERFGVSPKMFRLLFLIFLSIALLRLNELSHRFYAQKSFPVGEGGDRMLGPESVEDEDLRQALLWLRQNTTPTNSLAVMPEGAMLNYLARRANPTPYVDFSLPYLQHYGEDKILSAYALHSPDYIALMHCESGEYGVGYFGLERGYGRDIMQWVRTNYSPVWLIGHEPLQTNIFGIRILKKNPPAPPHEVPPVSRAEGPCNAIIWRCWQAGHAQGRANALIGEADGGKTLFLNDVVIPVLGGVVADTYDYTAGRTSFNGDWTDAVVRRGD